MICNYKRSCLYSIWLLNFANFFLTNSLTERSRDASKSITKKKKRVKTHEFDTMDNSEFVIGKGNESEEYEEIKTSTNKISRFKPKKGTLMMLSISQAYKDRYIICNHTRNMKGYMSAENGDVSAKSGFVYAVVIATQSKENDKTFERKSHKLQLSDNLHIFNTFLSSEKIVRGMQLRGIVERKEDKGYVIDLCFKDNTKAFLNFNDYAGKELKLGSQVTVVVISSKSSSQKIVKCKHMSTITDISETIIKSKSINYECIKPGFLVQCTVDSVVDNGLNVQFCKGISGVIFMDHLKDSLKKYKPKQEIVARVITVDFDKRISLSELPHIVNHQPVKTQVTVGDVLKNVRVVSNVYGSSYLVEGESEKTGDKIKCFLHKMHVAADSKQSKIAKKREKTILDLKKKPTLNVGDKLS